MAKTETDAPDTAPVSTPTGDPAPAVEPIPAPADAPTPSGQAVQSSPDGSTPGPQATADLSAMNATEILALAGDELARRALGQPTASSMLAAGGQPITEVGGFELGKAAPRDVFLDLDGKPADPSTGEGGFQGSQIAVKGSVVDQAALVALTAAGVS